jgi:beta-phosphoglucomutase-like phosphatase (HAD superfamily)
VDQAPDPAGAALPLERIDAVVFDTDGVLTDTASVHAAAWKRLFDEYLRERSERLGEPFRPFGDDDYLRFVDGKPRYDGVASFLASRGITLPAGTPSDPAERETVAGLGNRKNGYFLAQVEQDGVRPFPTSVELVRALWSRGVRLAAVSASRNFAVVLRAAGLQGLFDAEVDGVDAARLGLPGKPDPALFLEAASRPGGAGGGGRGRPRRRRGRTAGRLRPGRRGQPRRPGRGAEGQGRRRGGGRPGRAAARRRPAPDVSTPA